MCKHYRDAQIRLKALPIIKPSDTITHAQILSPILPTQQEFVAMTAQAESVAKLR